MARLPIELFHHIAERLAECPYGLQPEAAVTLFNLRLVSHDVCKAVQDTFLRTFFSHRQHLYTTYALKDLVKLTSHPVMRKRLGSLHIHVTQPQFWDLERFSPGLLDDVEDDAMNGSLLVNYRLQKQSIHECCMDLLVTALHHLREAGITPKLHFLEYEPEVEYRIVGSKQLHKSLQVLRSTGGTFEHWRRFDDLDLAVETGLVAMSRAAFQPKDLTLGDIHYMFSPISRGPFDLSSSTTRDYWIRSEKASTQAVATWTKVESLALGIDEQHLTTSTGPQPIASWFQAAASLKNLSLVFPRNSNTSWYLQRPNVEMLNSWLSNTRLKCLTLENMLFSEDAFLSLLAQHGATLQELTAIGVGFPASTDCARLFRWIAANMRLRFIDLQDLRRDDKIVLYGPGFFARDEKCIREGLENIAKKEGREEDDS